ncbi:DUF4191 domain-containing protein [Kribbia dieselivorans]|uniref:DUF4191 domain-containing protein n=1 Tax=Kribbia dieselivorans TaxID=331526 RepID=UPI000837E455|nr:DUF4191 domain-containing protein [Kribbia dieselivorans]
MARSTASDEPKKKGNFFSKAAKPFKDIWTAYRQIRTIDKQIDLWMAVALLGTAAIGTVIGTLLGYWWLGLILGLLLGFSVALFVLGRRGEKAAYRQMEGQTGAGGAALMALGKGWYLQQEPVAAEPGRRGNDLADTVMVFRALGKPGVILVAEGPHGRADKALTKEQKKVERVVPGVPVHTFYVGQGEGAVGVGELNRLIRRLPRGVTDAEMSVTNKRLKSLPGVRQNLPAGVDPTKARIDRRAMRGR